jgi:hypothetical protein
MAKKHFFKAPQGAVALALVLALGFGLVDAWCANPPDDPAAAEKLAADINAIKRGSANASGAEVTVTGSVEIKNGLTVPQGVTLTVTADKAALGLRNSALTVNGTVNAGTNHIQVKASWATIDGSGTIRLQGQGHLLRVEDKKKLTLDGVTLVGVNNNRESLVGIGRGGEFILKSGAVTGNSRTDPGSSGGAGLGGGVFVSDGGAFTMEGGTISANSAVKRGGGVCNGGAFTMKGGVIFGNSADIGGGVSNVDNGNVFIMEGGRIQGNKDSDGFTKNTAATRGAAMQAWPMAKWPTGGTYTKGGVPQTGGIEIVTGNDWTNDTLIATKK